MVDGWTPRRARVYEWSRGFDDPPDGYPRYAVRGGMAALARTSPPGLDVRLGTPCVLGAAGRGGHGRWASTTASSCHAPTHWSSRAPSPRARRSLMTADVPCRAACAAPTTTAPSPCSSRSTGRAPCPRPAACSWTTATFSFVADNHQQGHLRPARPHPARRPRAVDARWDDDRDELTARCSTRPRRGSAAPAVRDAQLRRWRFAGPSGPLARSVLDGRGRPAPLVASPATPSPGPRSKGAALSGVAAAAAARRDVTDDAGRTVPIPTRGLSAAEVNERVALGPRQPPARGAVAHLHVRSSGQRLHPLQRRDDDARASSSSLAGSPEGRAVLRCGHRQHARSGPSRSCGPSAASTAWPCSAPRGPTCVRDGAAVEIAVERDRARRRARPEARQPGRPPTASSLTAASLEVDESLLTGEADPVAKDARRRGALRQLHRGRQRPGPGDQGRRRRLRRQARRARPAGSRSCRRSCGTASTGSSLWVTWLMVPAADRPHRQPAPAPSDDWREAAVRAVGGIVAHGARGPRAADQRRLRRRCRSGWPGAARSCRSCPPSRCWPVSTCCASTRPARSPRARWRSPRSAPWATTCDVDRRARPRVAAADPTRNATQRALAERFPTPPGVEATAPCRSRRPASGARVAFDDHGTWVLGAPEMVMAGELRRRLRADGRPGGRRRAPRACSSPVPTPPSTAIERPDGLAPIALVVLADRMRPDAARDAGLLRRAGRDAEGDLRRQPPHGGGRGRPGRPGRRRRARRRRDAARRRPAELADAVDDTHRVRPGHAAPEAGDGARPAVARATRWP